jgi:tetraacyldisaccharide-1-P 4'-kinase
MTAKDAVKCENIEDSRLWVAEAEMCFSDPDFLPWLNVQLNAKSVQSHLD